ncbi:MAG: hypothetical protein ISS82_03195 [Nanoarchaeota archaeon]|nr:hypothetical protein [Nanoarchaeota archaeon]
MAFDLYNVFYDLQSGGVYEFVLPFLLIFTITFAILEKTKILGSSTEGGSRKNINAVVALILGLLMVTQFEIVQTMNSFLPKISLFLVIAVMFMVLVSLFGARLENGFTGILFGIATLITLVVIYWALGPSLGFEVPWWIEYNWETILFVIIIIIILFVIIGGGKQGKSLKNYGTEVGEFFEKLRGAK